MQLYQAHSPRSILESTLGLMEQDQAEGRVNEQELADLVRVAMVTGHSSLAVQALELAIGVGDLLPLPETEELKKSYPSLSVVQVPDRTLWSSLPAHRRLAMEGRFEAAVCAANSREQREEVAETLALMQDFDGAWLAAHEHVFPSYRRVGPLMVMAVELHRLGAHGEAEGIYGVLLERFDSPAMRMRVALGWSGLRPWDGYPYMDW